MAEFPVAEPGSRTGSALPALASERQCGSSQVAIATGVETRLCMPILLSVTSNASGPHR